MTTNWKPTTQPPDTSRTVMLRFDVDRGPAARGFYWRPEGAWYKSEGSKAKKNSVHPVRWRELTDDERKEVM